MPRHMSPRNSEFNRDSHPEMIKLFIEVIDRVSLACLVTRDMSLVPHLQIHLCDNREGPQSLDKCSSIRFCKDNLLPRDGACTLCIMYFTCRLSSNGSMA